MTTKESIAKIHSFELCMCKNCETYPKIIKGDKFYIVKCDCGALLVEKLERIELEWNSLSTSSTYVQDVEFMDKP